MLIVKNRHTHLKFYVSHLFSSYNNEHFFRFTYFKNIVRYKGDFANRKILDFRFTLLLRICIYGYLWLSIFYICKLTLIRQSEWFRKIFCAVKCRLIAGLLQVNSIFCKIIILSRSLFFVGFLFYPIKKKIFIPLQDKNL